MVEGFAFASGLAVVFVTCQKQQLRRKLKKEILEWRWQVDIKLGAAIV